MGSGVVVSDVVGVSVLGRAVVSRAVVGGAVDMDSATVGMIAVDTDKDSFKLGTSISVATNELNTLE